MQTNLFRYLCAVLLCITAVATEAQEVTLQHQGLTLNARLELAVGRKPADGVILITHGALAHRDMEIIAYLQSLFKERGHNTLAINLSLGLNDRHDMYDCNVTHRHSNDGAVEEIGAWVSWLQTQGAKRVTLLGHSRGGAQTALYALERDNPAVKAVVLLAPATGDNTDAASYRRRYDKSLNQALEAAWELVRNGAGGTVLEHTALLTCRDTSVTAETFVSYYGQDPRLDTPYLVARLSKPTLVVVAGNDEVVVGLDNKLASLTDSGHLRMEIIDSADHFFRDLYADDAVDVIDAFLKGVDGQQLALGTPDAVAGQRSDDSVSGNCHLLTADRSQKTYLGISD